MAKQEITAFFRDVHTNPSLRDELLAIRRSLQAKALALEDAVRAICEVAKAAGHDFAGHEYEAYAREANALRGRVTEEDLDDPRITEGTGPVRPTLILPKRS